MPIPSLNENSELPPGIHVATIPEVEAAFGQSNDRRRRLMMGLREAITIFKTARVSKIFVDGSFTTDKEEPNDIDGCWSAEGADLEKMDRRFWDFASVEDFEKLRKEIKDRYGIDFFIAEIIEGKSGKPFPEFFQTNRDGDAKGIIQINL